MGKDKGQWEEGGNKERVVSELTDMDDVPVPVDHDVSVVTVLDLEDIARDRVGCHALDEVHARLLKRDRVDTAVLVDEEREQVVDLGPTHLVSRGRVGDDVDDSALSEKERGWVSEILAKTEGRRGGRGEGEGKNANEPLERWL